MIVGLKIHIMINLITDFLILGMVLAQFSQIDLLKLFALSFTT